MATTYIIYKETERGSWVFETVENGKPTKHYTSSKRKAIMAVLRLNPGVSPIILSFQSVSPIILSFQEEADENEVGE